MPFFDSPNVPADVHFPRIRYHFRHIRVEGVATAIPALCTPQFVQRVYWRAFLPLERDVIVRGG